MDRISFLLLLRNSVLLSLLLGLLSSLHALNIAQRFPSSAYVLKEFDIDPSYLHSSDFMNFVNKNELKYRRFYEHSSKRGKVYIPLFKKLLRQGGLSHLFIYMSMTESGFQSYAVSNKKAAGLWQFMAATARRFDLEVGKDRDERYDPIASTKAAMRYIQTLYRMFGKWYLVMMAYNCGEGRLAKAIQKARSDDFALLMDETKKYLPAETRNYLKKILLLSMMGEKIQKSPKKEDIKIRDLILPDTEVLVNIYGGTTLKKMAKLLRMKVEKLTRLNPQFASKRVSVEMGMTQIFIPVDRLGYYRAFYRPPTLEEIYRNKGYRHLVTHIVRKGESLRDIARKYHTTPLDLIVANELASAKLHAHSLIMVPVSEMLYERLQRNE